MSNLEAIDGLYKQVDNFLESWREAADSGAKKHANIEKRQQINDQAYFVLAWGQLEADIEEACRNTIRQAQLHGDWRYRRVWTLYNPESRRLSGLRFEDRLTLVIDKDTENWKAVKNHYAVRNKIAHGSLQSKRIYVSDVIQEFYRIQSSLA